MCEKESEGQMSFEEKIKQDEAPLNEEQVEMTENADEIVEDEKEAIENEEVEKYITRLQRLQADYDNLRRRSQKEKQQIGQMTKETLICGILPVIDNFERALQAFENEESTKPVLKEGMQMVFRQLMDILTGEGLETILSVGEPFDINKHEAMMQVEKDEVESNQVVEEFQKGYTLKSKVIRPAKVTVAK